MIPTAASRRRLLRAVRISGRALFHGGPTTVCLGPGRPGAGWRWAVDSGEFRSLTPGHWVPQANRSTLQHEDCATVQVCEHVLAAGVLWSLDDLDIRFVGAEAPILDGSAWPFVHAMRQAGIGGDKVQESMTVSVTWQGRTVTWQGGVTPARARTFIARSDGAAMLADGRFPGARPGCSVVFNDDGSARFGRRPRLRAEPAWHKLLDLLGDLGPYRAGGRIRGQLEACNPTHAKNDETIRAALDSGQLQWLQEPAGCPDQAHDTDAGQTRG